MNIKSHFPMAVVACAFAAGILLAQIIGGGKHLIYAVSAVFLCGVFIYNRFVSKSSVFLLILVTLCGMMCAGVRAYPSHNGIKGYYYSQQVDIVGRVASEVRKRKHFGGTKMDFSLIVEEIKSPYNVKRVREKILVQIFNHHDVRYGDVIHLHGKLHRPFNFANDNNFSYPKYLYYRGIRWILSVKKKTKVTVLERGKGNLLRRRALLLRKKYEGILEKHLSEKEAGIMKAVLLGNRTGVPKHIKGLFVQTGTAHVLAISGLHVGVVVGFFLMLVKIFPVGRKTHYLITIGLLVMYVLLTGIRPSVVRAAIMIGVFLASYLFERKHNSYNTLGLAAVCLLVYNPFYLYDIGFQLSFICVFSIIFTSQKIRRNRFVPGTQRYFGGKIKESLLISAGIWVGIAGVIAYYFSITTPVTIVANLFVVPLLGILTGMGFGLMLTGSFSFYLAHMFAMCVKIALNAMIGVIAVFNEIPFAYIHLKNVTIWHVAAYYCLIGLTFGIIFYGIPAIRKK